MKIKDSGRGYKHEYRGANSNAGAPFFTEIRSKARAQSFTEKKPKGLVTKRFNPWSIFAGQDPGRAHGLSPIMARPSPKNVIHDSNATFRLSSSYQKQKKAAREENMKSMRERPSTIR